MDLDGAREVLKTSKDCWLTNIENRYFSKVIAYWVQRTTKIILIVIIGLKKTYLKTCSNGLSYQFVYKE